MILKTCAELCACIDDAIRILAQGPLSLYVPNFNWNTVSRTMGLSSVFEHLVAADDQTISEKGGQSIEDIVLQHLDLDRGDFSPDVPLTAYGLDSLSAMRLAGALRSFVNISQLQLLDCTLKDIQRQTQTSEPHTATRGSENEPVFDLKAFHQHKHTIVKALESDDPSDIPLILIHGGSGAITLFHSLLEHFTTPLWFVQMTPDMPTISLNDVALFYVERIKAARPQGPYRIASFCASSIIAVEMVRALEAGGDAVLQLVFIDHVPTLWFAPRLAPSSAMIANGAMDEAALENTFRVVLTLSDLRVTAEAMFHAELQEAWTSRDESHPRWRQVDNLRCLTRLTYEYLLSLAPADRNDAAAFRIAMRQALCERVRNIRAPITVWVASEGFIVAEGDPISSWTDMGISSDAVYHCPGSHDKVFLQRELITGMEFSWTM
jgi:thioesterase domain-containing protein/aryl carrier-like protein